jgi:DNA repair protein RecN (Recombination protein N)
MLVELAVRDLGVIADARVEPGRGATALTGETGAGKTMIVEALELLRGGRADAGRVRVGAERAEVEALFVVEDPETQGGEREVVLRRVVPASGRSRAYVDGHLVPVAQLEALAADLIEIHGQHAQQGLLRPSAQRDALDRYADVETAGLDRAVARVRELRRRLADLGGDERSRARELDLLRYQLDEIDGAALAVGEVERLDDEEDLLAGALEHRAAAEAALEILAADGGVGDTLAGAATRLSGRVPFLSASERLASLGIELTDVIGELRDQLDVVEVDDVRLAEVRARRQRLVELCRKYGERVEDVLDFAQEARGRLEELERREQQTATIDVDLAAALAEVDRESQVVGAARRAAAPELAAALAERLRSLAMPECVVEIRVEDSTDLPGAGDRVTVLLAANPGAPPGPLQRVASGGELSRVMLALRLVSSGGPPTMVFDEVDAGIGGAAATAVADALAGVALDHQVLVVTHLAQIAAAASTQVAVTKAIDRAGTMTTVRRLEEDERVVELSRMLSGSPDSATARRHAEELLAARGGSDPVDGGGSDPVDGGGPDPVDGGADVSDDRVTTANGARG